LNTFFQFGWKVRALCDILVVEGLSMTREFSVVIERDKDGWLVATVPELRGCHTQAKTLDALMKRVKEAIELCLEVEEPVANEFVGVQRVVVKV
jgi:predicted RNase H-like HicB family nuclease